MTDFKITVDDYPRLKRHYDLAIELGQKEFVFKGQPIVTEFAKYVLEYLKPLHEKKS